MQNKIMKENEIVEFKKLTSELKEGIISIVSISNKHGKGELYFGLDNNGKSTNQKFSEKTLRDISQAISNYIEPKIYPKVQFEKNHIKISFRGKDIPYFAYGRAFIRVADEDKRLSARELENIILKKEKTKWDSKESTIKINDILIKQLKKYLEKANQSKRINFKFTNTKSILEKLKLMQNNKLTNASKILFSKNKPLEVQLAIFAGTTKTTFLDIKQHFGNIFELLEICEIYISENIRWKADLSGSKRMEIPEIPIRAIKEALVNSFCHRDYIAPESNKIAIYKNKIEIWNPGNFPEGYIPFDFIKKETPSILRNPLIANILYLSEDIEKWGSGLKRIYDVCKKNNVKVNFKLMQYGFSIVFEREMNAPVNAPVDAPVNLTNLQENILKLIKNNQNITYNELSLKLNTHRTTIMRNISKLKILKLLKRIGSDKSGYWEIE